MSRITPFFGPILCRESCCLGDTFQPYKKWWVTQIFFIITFYYTAMYINYYSTEAGTGKTLPRHHSRPALGGIGVKFVRVAGDVSGNVGSQATAVMARDRLAHV